MNPLLPYGVAGSGSLSNADVQAFLFPFYHDRGLTESTTYFANLSGTVVELPAGDLGVAVGYEHRNEQGRFVPDAFNQAGLSTGLPATTTAGGYKLDEVYVELAVPLLREVPFAHELSLSIASRYSDYSTFGDTINNKFGLVWRPIEDLLVRATFAEGFRAPSVDNLYGGVGGSFESYTDPCGSTGAGNVAGGATCSAAGVPADYVQLGQGLIPCTSFPCQTPDQFLSGSNPNLTPETAESRTAGIVYSPQWVDGLDISLDWYSVAIDNLIATDSVTDILQDCYLRGISERCTLFTRDPSDFHINALSFALTNKGRLETEGYDLGVRYKLPETSFGNFDFDCRCPTSPLKHLVEQQPRNRRPAVGLVRRHLPHALNLGVNWQHGVWVPLGRPLLFVHEEDCVVTDEYDADTAYSGYVPPTCRLFAAA